MGSRLNQEHFKNQEEIWFQDSRIKFHDLSFKNQESRIIKLRIQESRKVLKSFSKHWVEHEFFTKPFTKEFLLSSNQLPVYCNRLPVAKIASKSFQLNLQHSNWFQNGVIDYNDLVIDYQYVWTLKFKFNCEESYPFTKMLCVIGYNDWVIDYKWWVLNKNQKM